MPQFDYRVRDKQGHELQRTEEVATEEELVTRLQNEGLLVISVTRRQELAEQKKLKRRRAHRRITTDDLILFARQLATMLDAGVTLLKSLDVLSRQIESERLYRVVEDVKHQITSGSTFRDALAKHPKVFSEFWVHIVETGEASGALPVVLEQLADYLESVAALRRKIVSALFYPIVLMVISIIAMVIFTVWIIPLFSRIFEEFKVPQPFITSLVIAFSQLIRNYFAYLALGIAIAVYSVGKYLRTKNGKMQFDRLILKIPFLSSLVELIVVERFASGLSILIESGVPILYGLDIISKATDNKVIEAALIEVRESVREGKGMARPLEQTGVFSPMVVQMVAVGEEIGELSKMLGKVSEFYKEQIDTILTRLMILIEPAVLIFMGIIVGIIVVAMFLPIFQLALVAH